MTPPRRRLPSSPIALELIPNLRPIRLDRRRRRMDLEDLRIAVQLRKRTDAMRHPRRAFRQFHLVAKCSCGSAQIPGISAVARGHFRGVLSVRGS